MEMTHAQPLHHPLASSVSCGAVSLPYLLQAVSIVIDQLVCVILGGG